MSNRDRVKSDNNRGFSEQYAFHFKRSLLTVKIKGLKILSWLSDLCTSHLLDKDMPCCKGIIHLVSTQSFPKN